MKSYTYGACKAAPPMEQQIARCWMQQRPTKKERLQFSSLFLRCSALYGMFHITSGQMNCIEDRTDFLFLSFQGARLHYSMSKQRRTRTRWRRKTTTNHRGRARSCNYKTTRGSEQLTAKSDDSRRPKRVHREFLVGEACGHRKVVGRRQCFSRER